MRELEMVDASYFYNKKQIILLGAIIFPSKGNNKKDTHENHMYKSTSFSLSRNILLTMSYLPKISC